MLSAAAALLLCGTRATTPANATCGDKDGAGAQMQMREDEAREQELEQKALMVYQQCPDIEDFDQIKAMLIAHNGNVQAVIDGEKAKHVFEIIVVNIANHSEQIPLTFHKS